MVRCNVDVQTYHDSHDWLNALNDEVAAHGEGSISDVVFDKTG